MRTTKYSTKPTFHLWPAALLSILLLAAACTTSGEEATTNTEAATAPAPTASAPSDTTASGETTPPTSAAPLSASWQGVTEDSIKIGLAYIDAEAVLQFGVDLNLGPQVEHWQSWINASNARGGINGRQLDLVSSSFLPVGTEESAATCQFLAGDEQVFAVAGSMLDDNPLCFTELNEVPYFGAFGLSDEKERRSIAPFIAMEMALPLQRERGVLTLINNGSFEGKALGVWYGEADETVTTELVIPALEAAGVNVVGQARMQDFGSDTEASNAFADSLIEQFNAQGADSLLNVSAFTVFTRAVQRNDFQGDLFYLNGQIGNEDLVTGDAEVDTSKLEGAVGVIPDKPTLDELWADPLFVACIDEFNESYPDLAYTEDNLTDDRSSSLAQQCATWKMLEAVLLNASTDLSPDALRTSVEGLGTIDLPGSPGSSFGPGKYSGGNDMRLYQFDTATQRFLPTGETVTFE